MPHHPWCRLPLVACLLVLALLLTGCGGYSPEETVRQFHIGVLTEDADLLKRVSDTSGVTTPADDFRNLRDLVVFLTRTYKPTEKEQAVKLVDAAFDFSINDEFQGEGKEVLCAIDFAQILVPFLGDAAKNVMGKPKDVVRYAVKIKKVGNRWVVSSITLPQDEIIAMSTKYELDLEEMDKVPGQLPSADDPPETTEDATP